MVRTTPTWRLVRDSWPNGFTKCFLLSQSAVFLCMDCIRIDASRPIRSIVIMSLHALCLNMLLSILSYIYSRSTFLCYTKSWSKPIVPCGGLSRAHQSQGTNMHGWAFMSPLHTLAHVAVFRFNEEIVTISWWPANEMSGMVNWNLTK